MSSKMAEAARILDDDDIFGDILPFKGNNFADFVCVSNTDDDIPDIDDISDTDSEDDYVDIKKPTDDNSFVNIDPADVDLIELI